MNNGMTGTGSPQPEDVASDTTLPPALPTFHASVPFVGVVAHEFNILFSRPRPKLRNDVTGFAPNGEMQPVALVYLSPVAAKALAAALAEGVRQYEQRYGEIWVEPGAVKRD